MNKMIMRRDVQSEIFKLLGIDKDRLIKRVVIDINCEFDSIEMTIDELASTEEKTDSD
jgi:hypothetical protein